MRLRWQMVLLGVLAGGAAKSDFDAAHWAYYSPVVSPESVSARYAQVVLDKAVYTDSNLELSDLRVIADGKREIPYKLLVDSGGVADAPYDAAIQDKSVVPGQYSSFVLDLGEPGMLSNRVEIQTSSTNFMRKVEIDAGNDAVNWAVLRNDGYIFDFSRDYHSRGTAVTYPDTSYRYIRVKVWNYKEPPLAIDGAAVYRRKVEPAREAIFYQGIGTIVQNQEEKSTDIEIDLGSIGIPVSKLVVSSPSMGYNRWVEIAGSNDRKEWMDLCSGQILKYDTPVFKGEESSIPCRGGYRYLRMRIRNYDDQPIQISSVKVFGARHRVFFPFKSGASYCVYYGSREATAPVYDIQGAFKYLAAEKPVELALGSRVKNPAFVKPIGTKTWFEENPWILWVVLLAAVALLGVLIVRSIIATKEVPPGR